MITSEELNTAKILWEQSKESALLAHESWALVIQSYKTLKKGFRSSGLSFDQAEKEFEKLMEDHSGRYIKSLEHMDKMNEAYGQLLNGIQ